MYSNQSCSRHQMEREAHRQAWAGNAAKGYYGNAGTPGSIRSMQRASVNIYKTENSYEMLVFAPGRIKEHFKLDLNGNELIVSYSPPEGFPRPEWVLREYSRGGFKRTFELNERIDKSAITAKYVDGVLQVSLPVLKGQENSSSEIKVS